MYYMLLYYVSDIYSIYYITFIYIYCALFGIMGITSSRNTCMDSYMLYLRSAAKELLNEFS